MQTETKSFVKLVQISSVDIGFQKYCILKICSGFYDMEDSFLLNHIRSINISILIICYLGGSVVRKRNFGTKYIEQHSIWVEISSRICIMLGFP